MSGDDSGILVWEATDGRWYISVVQTTGGRVVSHYFTLGNRHKGYPSRFVAIAALWFLAAKKRRYSPDEQNPYLTGEKTR